MKHTGSYCVFYCIVPTCYRRGIVTLVRTWRLLGQQSVEMERHKVSIDGREKASENTAAIRTRHHPTNQHWNDEGWSVREWRNYPAELKSHVKGKTLNALLTECFFFFLSATLYTTGLPKNKMKILLSQRWRLEQSVCADCWTRVTDLEVWYVEKLHACNKPLAKHSRTLY